MDLQPTYLQTDILKLVPLAEGDFETLYAVASDPLLWEQHPNPDRCERPVFQEFFKQAILSKSAFKIIDQKTGETMGSSRYYDFFPEKKSIAIGFTFLGRKYWGGTYNKQLKSLMINYAFDQMDEVIFHVGETNFRSQKAVEKIGDKKIAVEKRVFSGIDKLSFVYKIEKTDWQDVL